MVSNLRYRYLLLVFLVFLSTNLLEQDSSWADIYKYIDEDGTVCFTDSPPKDKRVVKIISNKKREYKIKRNPAGRVVRTSARVSNTQYATLVHKIAEEHYIDPELIKAVIKAESNWDPFAISRKGAMGLMQLMPDTVFMLNVKNPFNPEENIRAGIRYLKYLLDRFNGDLLLALAAYNAGPTVVERFGGIPPISETQEYIKKVLSHLGVAGKVSNYGTGKLKLKGLKNKKEEIYRIRLADGSILYTNSGLLR